MTGNGPPLDNGTYDDGFYGAHTGRPAIGIIAGSFSIR
jgi:hypothetical protein